MLICRAQARVGQACSFLCLYTCIFHTCMLCMIPCMAVQHSVIAWPLFCYSHARLVLYCAPCCTFHTLQGFVVPCPCFYLVPAASMHAYADASVVEFRPTWMDNENICSINRLIKEMKETLKVVRRLKRNGYRVVMGSELGGWGVEPPSEWLISGPRDVPKREVRALSHCSSNSKLVANNNRVQGSTQGSQESWVSRLRHARAQHGLVSACVARCARIGLMP